MALANAEDLDAAVAVACAAFVAWRATPAAERGAVLGRAARVLEERVPEMARDLTAEQGKTLSESRHELMRAVQTLAWNGEEAGRLEGRVMMDEAGHAQRMIRPEPIGVVAAFTAWNFPAVLIARKLGAALAGGCSVVLKAAEEAPRTAAALVTALHDAGLPNGVVNLVFGDPPRVSEHLLSAPAVRGVTFTGLGS